MVEPGKISICFTGDDSRSKNCCWADTFTTQSEPATSISSARYCPGVSEQARGRVVQIEKDVDRNLAEDHCRPELALCFSGSCRQHACLHVAFHIPRPKQF